MDWFAGKKRRAKACDIMPRLGLLWTEPWEQMCLTSCPQASIESNKESLQERSQLKLKRSGGLNSFDGRRPSEPISSLQCIKDD